MRGFPSPGGVARLRRAGVDNFLIMDILTTIKGVSIKRNFVKNLPYNPLLKPTARERRKAGILSEVLFWMQVRNNGFHAIDFDRQRIIGNYIVDFYVKTLGLIVEIGAGSGDSKQKHFFESLGLKVFYIASHDVEKQIGSVLDRLEKFIIVHYGATPSSASG